MLNEDRLISATALQRKICGARCGCEYEDCGCEGDCTFDFFISNATAVDAVEVVHGRWLEKIDMVASYLAGCEEIFYECSVCNSSNFGESPYCPNCGAKMDGRSNVTRKD